MWAKLRVMLGDVPEDVEIVFAFSPETVDNFNQT